MGISNLHKELRPYSRLIQLETLRGRRCGVDAMAWLHRGCAACATELGTGDLWWTAKGQHAPYISFCLRMLEMLTTCGIVPVVVFDGGSLPAKEQTCQQRSASRLKAAEKAKMLHAAGQVKEAATAFAQTVTITADMAHELVVQLQRLGIEFVVSPYEADSQLAFLSLSGYLCLQLGESQGGLAAVITEDSDLVAYGCPLTLFKCDRSSRTAQALCLQDLFDGRLATAATAAVQGGEAGDGKGGSTVLSFSTFTLEMLQTTCVLAGCDFLPSIKGIGFRKAHNLVRAWRTVPRVIAALRRSKAVMPEGYQHSVQRAVWGFRHALVIDTRSGRPGCQLHMRPLPVELKEAESGFLGPLRDPTVAAGIAAGRLRAQPPYAPFLARALPALPPQQTGSPCQHRGPSRVAGHALSQSRRPPASVKSSWMRPARDLLADAAARNCLTGPAAPLGQQHTGAQEQQQEHAQGCAAVAGMSVQLTGASPGGRSSAAGSPSHVACSLHKRKRSTKENDVELAKVALRRKVRMPAGGTPTGRGMLGSPRRAMQAQAGAMAACTGAEAPSGPAAVACNPPAQAGLGGHPKQQPGDAAAEGLAAQSRTSVATVGDPVEAACGPAPDGQPEEADAAAGQRAAAVSCVVTPCDGKGAQQPVSLPGPQAGTSRGATLDADLALARAIAAEQMLPQQWLEWQLSPRCSGTPLSAQSFTAVTRSSSEPGKLRRASSQLAAEPANSIRRFFTTRK